MIKKMSIHATSLQMEGNIDYMGCPGLPIIGEEVVEFACAKCGGLEIKEIWDSEPSDGDHACDAGRRYISGYKCEKCGATGYAYFLKKVRVISIKVTRDEMDIYDLQMPKIIHCEKADLIFNDELWKSFWYHTNQTWGLMGCAPFECMKCGSKERHQEIIAGYSFLRCEKCGFAEFDD